jgi:sigma-B regulation protein RsbU (phosphoserine phosphatase)
VTRDTDRSPILLRAIGGPTRPSLELRPPGPVTVGRRPGHTLELTDEGVSRDHARIIHTPDERGVGWSLVDTESRHGTWLNGVRLPANRATPVRHADVISIHPWTFSVVDPDEGESFSTKVETMEDAAAGSTLVTTVEGSSAAGLTRRRLDLLLEAAGAMSDARDEQTLAQAVIEAACAGSGFANAAVLRPARQGDELEALAVKGDIAKAGAAPRVSRSLIRRASDGAAARLSGQPAMTQQAMSIVALNIDEALCVPISLASGVAAYLYLDNRGGAAGSVSEEAQSFAIGLARLASLALSNLLQRELEARFVRMESDLKAAAEAQRWILPRRPHDHSGLRISGRSRPGRGMAGDFYDVIELKGGRLGVTLGDVSGKGVAASVLMTASQGFLHAALREHADPVRAVSDLTRYVASRTPEGRFVTLWLGILDPGQRTLEYVDAGHGYAFLRAAGGDIHRLDKAGGPPVGVPVEDHPYESERVALEPDGAILIVSDGVIEQPDERRESPTKGEHFGASRVETILAAPEAASPVEGVFAQVLEHAGGEALADDATAVQIVW